MPLKGELEKGGKDMAELARFYGLIIKMFFRQSEHNPPHFHVEYGEFSV